MLAWDITTMGMVDMTITIATMLLTVDLEDVTITTIATTIMDMTIGTTDTITATMDTATATLMMTRTTNIEIGSIATSISMTKDLLSDEFKRVLRGSSGIFFTLVHF